MSADRIQCDRNYGRLGGWLVARVRETMPGYWELYKSCHFPFPDHPTPGEVLSV